MGKVWDKHTAAAKHGGGVGMMNAASGLDDLMEREKVDFLSQDKVRYVANCSYISRIGKNQ